MNAREELHGNALQQLKGIIGSGFPGLAEYVLAQLAHELAEKIRKAYTGDGPDEDNWILNPFDAADLIDPEAQR